MDNPNSTGGKALGIGSSALSGAGLGMLFGPIGAAIGGVIGAGYGVYQEYFSEEAEKQQSQGNITPMNDGIIFNKNDKFLSMKDRLIAGTNVNGNKDLAQAISGGGNSSVKHEFGELRINGSIELKGVNGMSTNLDINELLKNQEFRTSIASMVGTEFKRIPNMGKVQPKYA
jgi:hypothetical protein